VTLNSRNRGGSSFSFVLAGVRGDRLAVCQTRRGAGVRRNREREMTLGIGHLQPIVSLIAGVLILIMPRLLSYIVAAFLIISGVLGLGLLH
jgi:Protein of unknown function (DUF3096)